MNETHVMTARVMNLTEPHNGRIKYRMDFIDEQPTKKRGFAGLSYPFGSSKPEPMANPVTGENELLMVNGRPVEPMGQPIKCHFEWIGHALTHYCGRPPRAAGFYSCEDGVYLKVGK